MIDIPKHPDFLKIYKGFLKRYGDRGEEVYHRWLNKNKLDDTKPMPKHIRASLEGELISLEAYTEPVRLRDKIALMLYKKKFDELTDEQKNKVHKVALQRKKMQGENMDSTLEAAKWTRAYMNDLPDSSFAWVQPGGKKDSGGKTVPRTYRHLPYKDAGGKIDLPHLRNAIARLGQGKPFVMPANLRSSTQKRLQNILAKVSK